VAPGAGAVSATSSTTDASGEAKVTWTLGPQLGEQLLSVKWIEQGPAGNTIKTTATFSGIGLSAPYHVIRKVAGDGQTAPLLTKLAVQPEIQLLTVRDAGPALPKRESPMQQILIEWSVLTGGGNVGSQFVQSIFNGHASVDWTLGAPGPQSMRARTDLGLPADPRDSLAVTFTATSTLEPVRSIVLSPAGDLALAGPGETMSLTARTFAGTPLAEVFGRTVTWQSTQEFIATLAPGSSPSASTVILRGVAAGASDISATSEGIKVLTRVTVGSAAARRQRIAYGLARTSMPGLPVQASFNSTGGSLTVTSQGRGSYQVTIGGQASRQGETETLLITGVENYCKLSNGWNSGPAGDLTAEVSCFDTDANRADSEFTFMLLGDRVLEGHFGFTFADDPFAVNRYTPAKSFNSGASNPAPVSVQRVSEGSYLVTFPQNGVSPHALHVTAVGNDATRCNIASFQGDAVRVQCLTASYYGSDPADSKFALTLLDRGRPGAPVAYAWAVNDAEDEFEGAGTFTISPIHSYNAGGGVVRITRVFEGRYDVTFRGLVPTGAAAPAIHVVNRDVDEAKWCVFVNRTISNADLTVSVDCHSQDGDREDEAFYVIVIFP